MTKSFYPDPEVGGGLIAGGISCVLLIVCMYCGCQLWKWWPDMDLAEWDSSEEEGDSDDKGDSDDTDDEKKAKKAKKTGTKAPGAVQGTGMQYMQPQEGGADAGMGAGAAYAPGTESDGESQPAELRKGATYMPQQPGGDMMAQAPSAANA